MRTGKMPRRGLCSALPTKLKGVIFTTVIPTKNNILELGEKGKPTSFWGRENWRYNESTFTPLRQTLVLLMAALNNEL